MSDSSFVITVIVPIIVIMLLVVGTMLYLNAVIGEQMEEIKLRSIERENKIVADYTNLETCESKFIHLMKNDGKFWHDDTETLLYDVYQKECLK